MKKKEEEKKEKKKKKRQTCADSARGSLKDDTMMGMSTTEVRLPCAGSTYSMVIVGPGEALSMAEKGLM